VELVATFSSRSYEVTSFARSSVDITDAAAVQTAIANCNPAIAVNAAAYNKVDVAEAEPEAAFRANALAVRNLALACRDVGAKLVHFSTDYVFDGLSAQPYGESDPTHPLGAYAVSKLAGELYAAAYLSNALIIRTCGVFGPWGSQTPAGNFVETMLRLAAGGKPIKVVEDFIASPTYAPALAVRSADLIEASASGIFHIGGGEPISWYHWAAKVFAAAHVQPELLPSNENEFRTPARRPKYSALSNAKMEALGVVPMPSLDTAIAEYLSKRA
jgi:dTDP-4-dehydrorhamnose reductase